MLSTLVLVMGLSQSIQAAPIYLTFEGEITQTFEATNAAGLLGNLQVGDQLGYTFIVDFDVRGYYTMYRGDKHFISDELSSASYNDFFADYVSGSALSSVPDYFGMNCLTCRGSQNFGHEYDNGFNAPVVSIAAESTEEEIALFNIGSITDLFVEGSTGWKLQDRAYTSGGSYAWIQGNMTLAAINIAAPVPEPSTWLILSSGFLGMIFCRRMSGKKNS